MIIRNLTPHAVKLRAPEGEDTIIQPDPAGEARVASKPGDEEFVPGVPCRVFGATTFEDVTGLPEPVEGVILIVSRMVGDRVPGRRDVFVPGTGPKDGAIRDTANQIVAVTRIIRA